jgi:two-component system alkaline phosphatase synthesis response regulator PhoP
MPEQKILLIDNDYGFVSDIKELLEKNGFQVFLALSSQKGMELARTHFPSLILLEVDLPEMDGLEICRELRKISAFHGSYIVFLSSRNDNYIQILAYNTGADDFLMKPISERLLLSKVGAYFRRIESSSGTSEKRQGPPVLRIDYEKYLIIKDKREIELPKKEFEILSLLYKNPRRVFSRDEIKQRIWGDDDSIKNRTIDVHVKKLREKIGDELIKTIKGVGYKLDQD